MTKATIRAIALAGTLLALPLQAQTYYRQDSQYSVWQNTLNDGTPICYFKSYQQTSAGMASWGLSRTPAGNMQLYYAENGITWTGGKVDYQIDNYPRHYVIMIKAEQPGMLYASLGVNQSAINFLSELIAGNVLYVITDAGTRSFSLANSGPAMRDLFRCIDTIAPSSTLPPAVTPPAPGLPAPVYGNPTTPKFCS